MIKISELLKHDAFQGFNLIAGEKGLENEVNSIGILEYEPLEDRYDNFRKGDLIITSLMFAKDDKLFAEESIIKIINREIRGLAIKTVYYKTVSDKVIKYANKKGTPIFVFENTFFEDIIVAFTDSLRNIENHRFYEDKINNLIKTYINKSEVRDIVNELNSFLYENVICAYCIEKKYKNDNNVLRIISNLRLRRNKHVTSINNSIIKYKKGIMIIYSFKESNLNPIDNLKELMSVIGITQDKFFVGIGDRHNNLEELGYSIKESLCALTYSVENKIQTSYFENMGINKIFMPLQDNYWVKKFFDYIIKPIEKYDLENNSKLMLTAEAYVRNNGEIVNTAKEMFQHTNTIRYRLNKIKQITGLTGKESNFYEQLFIAINAKDTKIKS